MEIGLYHPPGDTNWLLGQEGEHRTEQEDSSRNLHDAQENPGPHPSLGVHTSSQKSSLRSMSIPEKGPQKCLWVSLSERAVLLPDWPSVRPTR